MPEARRHDVNRHAAREQVRCVRMADIVQSTGADARGLEMRREGVCDPLR